MCVCKFWHTNSCLCAVSNIVFFYIASSNVTCLYKLYQLWDVTMCNFSLKDAFLHYFDLRGRLQVQSFSWEDVSVYNLSHNVLCLGSTDMFPRSVSTTRRVHAHVHTLEGRCLLTFWVTKSFLCVTLNICQHVCHNRNDVQLHDLTYEPFSVCHFSHTKSCLRTVVWPTRRTAMHVHCEKTSL